MQLAASVSSLASTLSRSATTATIRSRIQADNQSIVTNAPALDYVFLDEEDSSLSKADFQAPIKLGALSISSVSLDSQLGLDWALIGFDENRIEEAQSASRKIALLENINLPKRVVPRLERDGTVVVIRGHGVIARGSISSSTTMMRLPHDKRFQEVWTVRLDNSLSKLKRKPHV
jgi:hypothetical protein